MDAYSKILYHFIAHQDEYVDLYPGKFVVIRADFKTAGAFDSKKEAIDCIRCIPMPAAYYRAIPGEEAYSISMR